MQTQAVLNLEVEDHRIVAYLAKIAGRNVGRFVVPPIDGIMTWASCGDEAFIRQRLEHLADTGRIERAVRTVKGESVNGYIVLPERLWRREKQPKSGPVSAGLTLSASDRAFLKACGIATD